MKLGSENHANKAIIRPFIDFFLNLLYCSGINRHIVFPLLEVRYYYLNNIPSRGGSFARFEFVLMGPAGVGVGHYVASGLFPLLSLSLFLPFLLYSSDATDGRREKLSGLEITRSLETEEEVFAEGPQEYELEVHRSTTATDAVYIRPIGHDEAGPSLSRCYSTYSHVIGQEVDLFSSSG